VRARIRRNNDGSAATWPREWPTAAWRSPIPRLTALAIISVIDWISFWYTARLGYQPEQAAAVLDDLLTHGAYRATSGGAVSGAGR
jgi:hypothetical protein